MKALRKIKSAYRGAWQATVHGVARVRHDLATNPPVNHYIMLSFYVTIYLKKNNSSAKIKYTLQNSLMIYGSLTAFTYIISFVSHKSYADYFTGEEIKAYL